MAKIHMADFSSREIIICWWFVPECGFVVRMWVMRLQSDSRSSGDWRTDPTNPKHSHLLPPPALVNASSLTGCVSNNGATATKSTCCSNFGDVKGDTTASCGYEARQTFLSISRSHTKKKKNYPSWGVQVKEKKTPFQKKKSRCTDSLRIAQRDSKQAGSEFALCHSKHALSSTTKSK